MQAVILAAGMGKRLKDLTKDNTKCMIKVNGVTLIERMLCQLEKKKMSRIIIVVGYKGQQLIEYISTLKIQTPIEYISNPIYDRTNNIYSLALAKEWLCKEDTMLFESDLIFEDTVIDELLNDSRDTLALVDKYESWMDGTCVKINEYDEIKEFVPKNKFQFDEIKDYYKTVNIYKFSKHFSETHYVPFLEAYQKALGENEYYEQVLRVITMLDEPEIRAKRLNGELWYEIDDIQDLDIAASMFVPNEDERVDLVSGRYGGYWRYPNLLDFCYLVNPFFPPQRLLDEMKSNFDKLITQYPSGMRVNSLLASKNFNVAQENIVIGNGAAELIKSYMSDLRGLIGVVRPTFEEYAHRYPSEKTVVYYPDNDEFRYTVDDLISYFGEKKIQNLILINPDNPSGNYIRHKDLLRLIEWTGDNNIQLLIDESFVDFSDEVNASVIQQPLLDNNKHLYVMKSISKSYGVPGIRIGVLASGNIEVIEKIKKDVAIWNLNSFAEFYMQIAEKYRSEYEDSLVLFRKERSRFVEKLSNVHGLRLIPTQANYVMAEILTDVSAKELNARLLKKYNILIKNLVPKLKKDGKQYVRLAIRSEEENNRLIEALSRELNDGLIEKQIII